MTDTLRPEELSTSYAIRCRVNTAAQKRADAALERRGTIASGASPGDLKVGMDDMPDSPSDDSSKSPTKRQKR